MEIFRLLAPPGNSGPSRSSACRSSSPPGIGRGGVVVAEIIGRSAGLGDLIQRAADTRNSPLIYAVLMPLGIVPLTLVNPMCGFEVFVAPWRRLEWV